MVLGIDLGTSNSMAAVYKDGEPIIIESRVGRKTIPSVVSVDERGIFYAGDVAKERKLHYPDRTVDAFKRSMGTDRMFAVGDKRLKPEELSAIVLRNIKEDACHFLGEEIKEAVISVPAFFSNPQRKAVIKAGELAGFNVKRIINEPTAAAMAYGVQNTAAEEEKVIMVLDLGGGTFDISVVQVTGNIMEVLAVCGDNHLGGEDFTKRLIDLFLEFNRIKEELSGQERNQLWRQAEIAKRMITDEGVGKMTCTIGGETYFYEITEEEYKLQCFELLEKIRKLTLRAISESSFKVEDIKEILMVGGGTKLSIVRKMIEKLSGRKMEYEINPDEAVAMGAALQGHLLEKGQMVKDILMTDICPYELYSAVNEYWGPDIRGVKDVLIPKNTTIPTKRKFRKVNTSYGSYLYMIRQSTGGFAGEGDILGEIKYIAPKLEGGAHVTITITYDMNGIIHGELYVHESKFKKDILINNNDSGLTDEEARKRLEELEYLKAGPMEEEENILVYERAERLYAEYTGEKRNLIGRLIGNFDAAIQSFDEEIIKNERERLAKYLDELEDDWI